jgi:hypothetical protein
LNIVQPLDEVLEVPQTVHGVVGPTLAGLRSLGPMRKDFGSVQKAAQPQKRKRKSGSTEVPSDKARAPQQVGGERERRRMTQLTYINCHIARRMLTACCYVYHSNNLALCFLQLPRQKSGSTEVPSDKARAPQQVGGERERESENDAANI